MDCPLPQAALVPAAAGHHSPSTGIGLASVQRIIQRHGGRTWA